MPSTISIPLAFALVQTTRQDRIEQQVREIVIDNVDTWESAELIELTVSQNRDSISVQGRVHSTGPILQEDIDTLNDDLEAALKAEVLLSLFDLKGELWLPTEDSSDTVEPDTETFISESTPLPDSQDE